MDLEHVIARKTLSFPRRACPRPRSGAGSGNPPPYAGRPLFCRLVFFGLNYRALGIYTLRQVVTESGCLRTARHRVNSCLHLDDRWICSNLRERRPVGLITTTTICFERVGQ
jgi:hypothetical protein